MNNSLLTTLNPYGTTSSQKKPIFSVYSVKSDFGDNFFIDNHSDIDDFNHCKASKLNGRTYLEYFTDYSDAVKFQKNLYV